MERRLHKKHETMRFNFSSVLYLLRLIWLLANRTSDPNSDEIASVCPTSTETCFLGMGTMMHEYLGGSCAETCGVFQFRAEGGKACGLCPAGTSESFVIGIDFDVPGLTDILNDDELTQLIDLVDNLVFDLRRTFFEVNPSSDPEPSVQILRVLTKSVTREVFSVEFEALVVYPDTSVQANTTVSTTNTTTFPFEDIFESVSDEQLDLFFQDVAAQIPSMEAISDVQFEEVHKFTHTPTLSPVVSSSTTFPTQAPSTEQTRYPSASPTLRATDEPSSATTVAPTAAATMYATVCATNLGQLPDTHIGHAIGVEFAVPGLVEMIPAEDLGKLRLALEGYLKELVDDFFKDKAPCIKAPEIQLHDTIQQSVVSQVIPAILLLEYQSWIRFSFDAVPFTLDEILQSADNSNFFPLLASMLPSLGATEGMAWRPTYEHTIGPTASPTLISTDQPSSSLLNDGPTPAPTVYDFSWSSSTPQDGTTYPSGTSSPHPTTLVPVTYGPSVYVPTATHHSPTDPSPTLVPTTLVPVTSVPSFHVPTTISTYAPSVYVPTAPYTYGPTTLNPIPTNQPRTHNPTKDPSATWGPTAPYSGPPTLSPRPSIPPITYAPSWGILPSTNYPTRDPSSGTWGPTILYTGPPTPSPPPTMMPTSSAPSMFVFTAPSDSTGPSLIPPSYGPSEYVPTPYPTRDPSATWAPTSTVVPVPLTSYPSYTAPSDTPHSVAPSLHSEVPVMIPSYTPSPYSSSDVPIFIPSYTPSPYTYNGNSIQPSQPHIDYQLQYELSAAFTVPDIQTIPSQSELDEVSNAVSVFLMDAAISYFEPIDGVGVPDFNILTSSASLLIAQSMLIVYFDVLGFWWSAYEQRFPIDEMLAAQSTDELKLRVASMVTALEETTKIEWLPSAIPC